LALGSLGRHYEAIEFFDKAKELNPNLSYIWYSKGISSQSIGNYSEAEQCYNEALNLEPKNIDALTALSVIYSEYLYEYDKALQLKYRVLEIDPDNSYARSSLAENLIKVRKYDEGRKYALQALKDKHDTAHQCIFRFLILSSYLLEGDITNCGKEIAKFLDYFRNLNKDFKVEEEAWTFRGLINSISSGSVDLQTKFLLLILIDLIQGKIDKQKLTFFFAF